MIADDKRARGMVRLAARDGQLVDGPPLVVFTFALRGDTMIALRNGKLLRLSDGLQILADQVAILADAADAAAAAALSTPGALR